MSERNNKENQGLDSAEQEWKKNANKNVFI
jgi:hypothetical protein